MLDLLRSRLFRRQFFPLLIIMTLLLGLLSATIFLRARDGILARELQIVATYRDAVLGSLDRWLDERVSETKRLASEIEVSGAQGQELGSYWRRFALMTGPGSPFTDLFLIDPRGFVMVSRTQTINRSVNLSDRDYARAALAGLPYMSGLFQGRMVGTHIFAISQPVRIGTDHWALAGVVSLSDLVAIVDSLDLAELGRALLVDDSGAIVSSPNFLSTSPPADGAARKPALQGDVAKRVLGSKTGSQVYGTLEGEAVFGAWGRVQRLGLTLLVELDRQKAMAPLGDILRFVWYISIAALSAVLFAAYSLTGRLVKPITALVEAVGEVRKDELRSKITMKTGTELDDLIQAFNEMASTVRDREADLKESASRDSLTGLYNHGRIEEFLEHEIRRRRRSGELLCFVMADIDHFKNVNDTYGHQAGDDALRGITGLLNQALREGDILGRYGGEEFAIILNANKEKEAAAFCERIRSLVEAAELVCDGHKIKLTMSLGFVCTSTLGAVPFDIVRRADRALYEAKNSGRNAVRQG